MASVNISNNKPPIYDAPASGSGVRIQFIDLAKVLILICAITEHTEAGFLMRGIDNMIVPVFWICAGYTSKPNFRLVRKARFLAYYAVLSLICMFCAVCLFGFPFDEYKILGFFYARYKIFDAPISAENPILLGLLNDPLWFLPSFFTTYCIFKLILSISSSFKGQAIACGISLLIASAFYYYCPVLLPWSWDMAFAYAVFLCIGYWIRKYNILERGGLKTVISYIIAYMCITGYTGMTNPPVRDYGSHWPSLILTGTLGVLAFLSLCRYFDHTLISRISVSISKETLFIFGLQLLMLYLIGIYYMWHYFIFDWKIRLVINLTVCFAGGYIVGRVYRLLVKGIYNLCKKFKTPSNKIY